MNPPRVPIGVRGVIELEQVYTGAMGIMRGLRIAQASKKSYDLKKVSTINETTNKKIKLIKNGTINIIETKIKLIIP